VPGSPRGVEGLALVVSPVGGMWLSRVGWPLWRGTRWLAALGSKSRSRSKSKIHKEPCGRCSAPHALQRPGLCEDGRWEIVAGGEAAWGALAIFLAIALASELAARQGKACLRRLRTGGSRPGRQVVSRSERGEWASNGGERREDGDRIWSRYRFGYRTGMSAQRCGRLTLCSRDGVHRFDWRLRTTSPLRRYIQTSSPSCR
jgi:hypothetical protein